MSQLADSDSVSVIKYVDTTVIGTIPVLTFPLAAAFTQTATCYVLNAHSNTVSVIDTATSSILSTIIVGSASTLMAVELWFTPEVSGFTLQS